jgi:glycosyltransferase involved in cell wall biosynthesis
MAAQHPTVSVVLPTYDRRDSVRRAIDSVLAQTFRDFELVVVDDGSSDGTRDALTHYGESLTYVSQPNAGVPSARNTGIRRARGRIVAFLDSDDEWLPEHLGVLVEALERHPTCVLASTCGDFDLRPCNSAGTHVVEPLPRLLIDNFVGYPSCVAVRTAVLRASGGFDERLLHFEASDLYLRLALHGPFALLRCGTVRRTETDSSISAIGRREGFYVTSPELSAVRLIEEVQASPHATPRLRAATEGNLRYAQSLTALARGDAGGFAASIREACALLPELLEEKDLVWRRLTYYLPHMLEPSELARTFADAARGWPEPRSPTGVALWSHALWLGVRARNFAEAVRLARRAPLPQVTRYVLGAIATLPQRRGAPPSASRSASNVRA